MKPLIISVFTAFDLANPSFLDPLGRPNPRLIGDGTKERNLVFRTILANPDTESPYSAKGELCASIGGKPLCTWPKDIAIPTGGAIVLQGMGPGVMDGLCVLDTVGIPDGPVNLDVHFKVDGVIVAQVICPLVIHGTDLESGGQEHPKLPDTPAEELVVREARVVVLQALVTSAGAEIKTNEPRIAKLKQFLAA